MQYVQHRLKHGDYAVGAYPGRASAAKGSDAESCRTKRGQGSPGWTGSHSQRRKVISFIAEYGCDAPTVKVQGQYNSRARCGRGRRYNSLSKAVAFSLFDSSKIIPSFQISCFLCLVFSKGQNISAGLWGGCVHVFEAKS